MDGHPAGRQLPQHLFVRHPGLAAPRVAPVQPVHICDTLEEVGHLRVAVSPRELVYQLVQDHAAFTEAHQSQRKPRRDGVGASLWL